MFRGAHESDTWVAVATLEEFYAAHPDCPNATRHLALLLTEIGGTPEKRLLELWLQVVRIDPLCERAFSTLMAAFLGGAVHTHHTHLDTLSLTSRT